MLVCHCLSFRSSYHDKSPWQEQLKKGVLVQLQVIAPHSGEAERAAVTHHIYRQKKGQQTNPCPPVFASFTFSTLMLCRIPA